MPKSKVAPGLETRDYKGHGRGKRRKACAADRAGVEKLDSCRSSSPIDITNPHLLYTLAINPAEEKNELPPQVQAIAASGRTPCRTASEFTSGRMARRSLDGSGMTIAPCCGSPCSRGTWLGMPNATPVFLV